MRARPFLILVSSLGIAALLAACGGQDTPDDDTPSVESIQESLEIDDTGGFTTDDELPMFGRVDLDALDLEPTLEVPELPADMNTLAGVAAPPDPNAKPDPNASTPPDPNALPCPHGLLAGHWKPIKNGFGVFAGKWASANGKVTGHLKGIYGKNKQGHGVFFGKYISKSGKFMGLLKGRYDKNHFIGVYHGKLGAKGKLEGAYGQAKCVQSAAGVNKCLPGPGNFVGKWHAFCPACQPKCLPGWVQPPGRCICVPAQVLACVTGNCPQGTFCDLCPPLDVCKPGYYCPPVCAPPKCRPLPPKPPQPAPPSSSDPNSAGTNTPG
jgi:hypothetical protein